MTCIFDFYDPLPCLNVEVVCGPRVLVVVHGCRKDHGKDLELCQPVLEATGEETKTEGGGRSGEGIRERERILRDVYRRVNSIEGKRQDGKEGDSKAGWESNEHRKEEWTEIREEKWEASQWKRGG